MQKLLLALVTAIFVIHTLATIDFWYFTYSWLDIPMHIAGGFFVAVLFIYLLEKRFKLLDFEKHHPVIFFILGLGCVALIGIAWEWYELFAQIYIQHSIVLGKGPQGDLVDTLKDLFDDLLGGALGLSSLRMFKKKRG